MRAVALAELTTSPPKLPEELAAAAMEALLILAPEETELTIQAAVAAVMVISAWAAIPEMAVQA
jgi:hypothetical protein